MNARMTPKQEQTVERAVEVITQASERAKNIRDSFLPCVVLSEEEWEGICEALPICQEFFVD